MLLFRHSSTLAPNLLAHNFHGLKIREIPNRLLKAAITEAAAPDCLRNRYLSAQPPTSPSLCETHSSLAFITLMRRSHDTPSGGAVIADKLTWAAKTVSGRSARNARNRFWPIPQPLVGLSTNPEDDGSARLATTFGDGSTFGLGHRITNSARA